MGSFLKNFLIFFYFYILGFRTGVFAPDEIENVFTLFDLKKDGFIGKKECQQALKTLASSELQSDKIENSNIPSKVD
jgi:hypothetical protein